MTRVKICGLTRIQDVELAVSLGADAVGFVREPTSPRFIASTEQMQELIRAAGAEVKKVAVYATLPADAPVFGVDAEQAIEFMRETVGRRIQVVRLRQPDTGKMPMLKGLAPSSVRATQSVSAIAATGQGDDFLLLDAYSAGGYGGMGEKIDWTLAAEIVALSQRNIILAGGLTPENVAEAIALVKPYAVDVSSGIEASPGVKDRGKVRDFIQAAKGA